MLLTRVIGLAIIGIGLLLVGLSGDNHSVPNGRAIVRGASLMGIGILVTLFARELDALLVWANRS